MDRKNVPFVVLLCFGLGFAFGYVVEAKLPSQIAKDGWDIATAVGTLAAVLVAVVFGVKAIGDNRRHRAARGLLALVFLNSALDSLKRDLNFMSGELLTYNDAEMGTHDYYQTTVFDPLRHQGLRAMTVEVLDVVSGFSDDVALHLGFAVSSLASMAGEMEPFVNTPIWTRLSSEHRVHLIRRCAQVALEAGLSVGYAVHKTDDLLKHDKRRLLRLAHDLYTTKKLGPPIDLKTLLGDV
jgi:hypothetical protein